MTPQEQIAWLQLIRTENIGPITFYRLMERFGSALKALEALPTLAQRGGRKTPYKIYDSKLAEKEISDLNKMGGKMLFAGQDDYPVSLSPLEDAPPVLSILGNLNVFTKPAVGVVGSRNASLNGRTITQRISKELGRLGYCVISGLARGIDTAAHEVTLDTGTVAVLAGGVDVLYPKENEKLYKQIIEQGCVISEQPLTMQPLAIHFPKRNRIISGLSQGVLIVEATLKSGSLITARFAGEQGRDVFAVPGSPLDPRAGGPNALIRDGAVLTTSADDIVRSLNMFKTLKEPANSPYTPEKNEKIDENELTSARDIIWPYLSTTPVLVDDISRSCQISIHVIQTALLEWELAGKIQRLPGNRFVVLADGYDDAVYEEDVA